MQVNVQVGRRAKTLNEGDGTSSRFAAFEARLPDQMRRYDPVNDLQYRGEQFGVHREEAAIGSQDEQDFEIHENKSFVLYFKILILFIL